MSAACCPTCGQALPDGPIAVEALIDVNLSGQQRAIVEKLVRAYPRSVPAERFDSALWKDDPDGGPDASRKVIHVHIYTIRRKIEPYGWTIPRHGGGAGNRAAYRLERLP